ncbi:MAG TPA: RagB/SusD family nutrient uptake outer membrane protein [Longimicrobiaceae bacterium]|nr:RagB/SusD family nutrient uptake outer membrane protein [Longimicrobiaceae bacterium]
MNPRVTRRAAGLRRRLPVLAGAAGVALALAGCDLDLSNPNALSEEDVLNDPNGLIALAVGLQSQYATSVAEWVRAPALVTDEWGTNTGSLEAYRSLLTGQNFDPSFAVVEGPWASAYRVVRTANTLLDNLGGAALDDGTRTGIAALAKTYRAMALGALALQFERAPVDVRTPTPVPQPRGVVLDSVAALLESARSDLAGSPDLAVFNARVLVPGVDLPNVINAMLARFYLADGEYQRAIEAAQRVNLASLSRFTFLGTSVNPIWNISGNSFYVLPLASFRAAAEAGDQRVDFWTRSTAPTRGNPDSLLVTFNRYTDRNDPFPVYLPDEMRLIQAEAHARLGNLPQARALINQVRTQCSSPLAEPVACLPALTDAQLPDLNAVLRQIAYERRYELYMQGLRWDDLRRLGAAFAVGAPPVLQFLPIPSGECRNNPQAGCVN